VLGLICPMADRRCATTGTAGGYWGDGQRQSSARVVGRVTV